MRRLTTAVCTLVLVGTLAGTASARRKLKPGEPDRYGRYRARLTLGGITPAAEQAAAPGEIIPSGFGKNNISINYRNASHRAWTSYRGVIYTTQFDPATKHYTGFEDLDIGLYSAKNKDKVRQQRKRRVVFLGKGITFAEPLRIRISARTSLGNYFWTEFTAPVERTSDGGFAIPGVHYLDHFSSSPGKDTPPKTGKPPPPAPASSPAPVAAPPKKPAPRVLLPPGKHGQRQIRPGVYEALPHQRKVTRVYGARAKVHLAGFTDELREKMASDPVKERRGNVRLFVKNQGARVWGLVKKTTWRGPIEDFEMRVPTKETGRISYDKPILVKVDVRTEAGKFYWTEVVRTREDLEAPLVLDRYTGD
jgi:hypothetical protein